MSVYKIEKGIPRPEYRHGKVGLYPLREMSVGDSFEVGPECIESVRRRMAYVAKALSRKFSARRMPSGGYRVWRVG
jgi:hypothetical protein